jgi:hypothetical protein
MSQEVFLGTYPNPAVNLRLPEAWKFPSDKVPVSPGAQ